MYRFVGNDPGIPGRLNPNYNPQYRTIAAEFEAMPGPDHPGRHRPDPGRRDRPARRAPSRTSCSPCPTNDPASPRPTASRSCTRVSRPYATGTPTGFTVYGKGFGATKGTGQLTLDGTT